jgi:hypothetical protein
MKMEEEELPLVGKQSMQTSTKSNILKAVGALALFGIGFTAIVSFDDGNDSVSPTSLLAKTSNPLTMSINNEYGILSEHTRDMYSLFDHIVEPMKESTFNVVNGREGDDVTVSLFFHFLKYIYYYYVHPSCHFLISSLSLSPFNNNVYICFQYTWTISRINDDKSETVIHTAKAPSIVHTFKEATNKWFKVQLVEAKPGQETKTYITEKVLSRYVRREIRSVSDKDRNMVLDAMEVLLRDIHSFFFPSVFTPPPSLPPLYLL